MHIENKNAILDVFYGEASPQEERRIRHHLQSCEDCRAYLRLLQEMDSALSHWPDEQPAPDSFDRILATIPQEAPKAVRLKPAFSAKPLFNIGFALVFILLTVYFVQSRLTMLPVWESLQRVWVIDLIGSYGFVGLLFLAAGIFLTLALAPVLYLDLHRRSLRI